jgi:hypothetical protein
MPSPVVRAAQVIKTRKVVWVRAGGYLITTNLLVSLPLFVSSVEM